MRTPPYISLLNFIILIVGTLPFCQAQIGWGETTTGGAGGDTFVVTGPTQFKAAIVWNQPLVVIVDDTIELTGMHEVASNKTIIGREDRGHIIGGGLRISEKTNIIIRNLAFRDWNDDAINIENNSTHVWVDHCDFTNGFDGCVDIRLGADLVTVSWNHFWNHSKVSLIGASDNNATINEGKLRVTMHHNWFDGTVQRHPRVRFSELCHVYNNYFLDNGLYGVGSASEADVLVENNYFDGCRLPTEVGVGASPPGDLVSRNNIIINNDLPPETRGTVEEPPYDYALDLPEGVPQIVMNWAGVQTSLSPTIDVNNSALGFEIYPNPFHNDIHIYLKDETSGQLEVFNLSGQRISKHQINTKYSELTLSNMPSGGYLFRMLSEDGQVGQKLLIKE